MVTTWLVLLAAQVATAGTGAATQASAPESWPTAMRHALVRLAGVEWRMRRNLADTCTVRAASAGIALDYIGAYARSDRGYVQAVTGLGDRPTIVAVMDGSPAQAAGLRMGDEIVSLDGTPTTAIAAASPNPALLADDIQDRIATYSPMREIRFSISRKGAPLEIPVRLVAVCGARIILDANDTIEAHSDGENIAVTTGLVQFTRNDDELALVAGHELAHVVHDGSKPAGLFGQRTAEDRADLDGARYALCAGYDVARAIDFWDRFASHDRLGWLRSPSHRPARERERRLRQALPGMSCPPPDRPAG